MIPSNHSGRTIDIRRPWQLVQDDRWDLAVVIDVLRATTTAGFLVARGLEVVALASPDDLESLSNPSDYVVFSELELPAPWRHLDNSPEVARTAAIDATPVLITTNGTRAMVAALGCAERVALAAFVNLDAVARWVTRQSADRIVVIAAGYIPRSELRHEDETCATELGYLLRGDRDDARLLESTRGCWQDARIMRRLDLRSALEVDFKLALTSNRLDCVPVVETVNGRVTIRTA